MRVAIFILDVFMEKQTGFSFLDAIAPKFQMASENAIIITGQASDDVVIAVVKIMFRFVRKAVQVFFRDDMTDLLEKPVMLLSFCGNPIFHPVTGELSRPFHAPIPAS